MRYFRPILTGLLTFGLASTPLCADDPVTQSPVVERTPTGLAALGDLLGSPTATSPELVRGIVAIGKEAPVAIFDALASGEVLTSAGEHMSLTASHQNTLETAATSLGRSAFITLLNERAKLTEPSGDQVAVLLLTNAIGDYRDLRRALQVATLLEPTLPSGSEACVLLSRAVASILDVDPRAYDVLGSICDRADSVVQFSLVRMGGLADTPDRARWLCDRLGHGMGLDLALLSELGRATQRPIHINDGRAISTILQHLAGDDVQLLREAARAAGRLELFEAVEPLVDLLSYESTVVRDEAHAALVRITGLGFSTQTIRWRSWLATETQWFYSEGQRHLDRLSETNPEVLASALAELSSHRLNRHDTAVSLAPLLQSESSQVRVRTVAALSRLGSSIVCDELIQLLTDENAQVRDAAHAALKTVTNLDLDPDSAIWEAATRSEA